MVHPKPLIRGHVLVVGIFTKIIQLPIFALLVNFATLNVSLMHVLVLFVFHLYSLLGQTYFISFSYGFQSQLNESERGYWTFRRKKSDASSNACISVSPCRNFSSKSIMRLENTNICSIFSHGIDGVFIYMTWYGGGGMTTFVRGVLPEADYPI